MRTSRRSVPGETIATLEDDVRLICGAYEAERRRLLEWQEQETEQRRARLKSREGFSTLTADQAHTVFRPLERAPTDTTVEAVAPPLEALKDPFLLALQRGRGEVPPHHVGRVVSEFQGVPPDVCVRAGYAGNDFEWPVSTGA